MWHKVFLKARLPKFSKSSWYHFSGDILEVIPGILFGLCFDWTFSWHQLLCTLAWLQNTMQRLLSCQWCQFWIEFFYIFCKGVSEYVRFLFWFTGFICPSSNFWPGFQCLLGRPEFMASSFRLTVLQRAVGSSGRSWYGKQGRAFPASNSDSLRPWIGAI